jgi:hypothetical protein
MIKNDLRNTGYQADFIEPKESPISFIWAVLTLAMMAASVLGVLILTKDMSAVDAVDPLGDFHAFIFEAFGTAGIVIYLLLYLAVYFGLKAIMTLLVCKDKKRSIMLKILTHKGIQILPVCHCKEALKVWQTVLIYLVPAAFMYSSLFALSVASKGSILYLPMLALLSFFIAFDLTLVLYVLFFKIKNGADYISVDLHVYQMTAFSKPAEENKRVSRRLEKA